MRHQRLITIIITVFLFFLQSCGPIKIGTLPELQGGSPLSVIKPVTFVINKFEDKRADFHGVETMQETDLFLDLGKDEKIESRGVERKFSDIIAEAISAELKRNGHEVLESKDKNKADVVIDGTILQYHLELHEPGYFGGGIVIAKAKINISVTKTLNSEKVLSKSYSGISNMQKNTKIEDVLKEALLNMVKDFSTDPEFLDILQRVTKDHAYKNQLN